MVFLLCFSLLLFVDSLLAPFSRTLDPRRPGEGMAFLILNFRAVSGCELSSPVMLAAHWWRPFHSALIRLAGTRASPLSSRGLSRRPHAAERTRGSDIR